MKLLTEYRAWVTLHVTTMGRDPLTHRYLYCCGRICENKWTLLFSLFFVLNLKTGIDSPDLNRCKCERAMNFFFFFFKRSLTHYWCTDQYSRKTHIPERCWKTHNSCCGSYQADCVRVQQKHHQAEGWDDAHSDTSEERHCGKYSQLLKFWMKQINMMAVCVCSQLTHLSVGTCSQVYHIWTQWWWCNTKLRSFP